MHNTSNFQTTIQLKLKDKIAYIDFVYPDSKGYLTLKAFKELFLILQEVNTSENVQVVVLQSKARDFSRGIDLNEYISFPSTIDAKEYFEVINNCLNLLFNLKKPSICLVQGQVIGLGAALSVCTDFTLIHENTSISFPEVQFGGIVSQSIIEKLIATLGLKPAKELLLTGKSIDAKTMLHLGLANHIFHEETKAKTLDSIIKPLLKASPIALALTKETMHKQIHTPQLYNGETFAYLYSTADWHQRIWYFLNKKED